MSLNKKQSSTYNKYACGCFLYAPSICSTYLSKRWLRAGIYCVAAQKSMLDVQQVRLQPPLMAVVMSTRVLLKQNSKIKNVYGCTFCTIMYDMDGFDKSLPCISRGGTQLAVIFC